MTTKRLPRRPISGGTNNGLRPSRYDYWRTGYGNCQPPGLSFWIAQAGEYHCKPGFVTGSFEHSQRAQLFYQVEGEAVWQVDGRTHTIQPGHLLLALAGQPFRYETGGGAKHHWLGLEGELPAFLRQNTPRHWPLPYDPEVESRLVELRETLIWQKPGYALHAIGLFYEAWGRIEALSGDTAVSQPAYPETVRNAMTYLRENYAQSFNAVETGTAVGVSPSHLRALFEKWLGESPRQFHTRYRIAQARRLLREQNLTVSEAAYHLGFHDARHFSRTFKRVTGYTPRDWRLEGLS